MQSLLLVVKTSTRPPSPTRTILIVSRFPCPEKAPSCFDRRQAHKKQKITKVGRYVGKDQTVDLQLDEEITLNLLNFFVEQK